MLQLSELSQPCCTLCFRLMPQDSQGFAVNTLVKVDFEPHPLFFRILALDHARSQLQVPAPTALKPV